MQFFASYAASSFNAVNKSLILIDFQTYFPFFFALNSKVYKLNYSFVVLYLRLVHYVLYIQFP